MARDAAIHKFLHRYGSPRPIKNIGLAMTAVGVMCKPHTQSNTVNDKGARSRCCWRALHSRPGNNYGERAPLK